MSDKFYISPMPPQPEGERYPGIEAVAPVGGVAEVLGPNGLEEFTIVGVRLVVAMTVAVVVDELILQIDGKTVAFDPDVHGVLVRVVLLND
ncbi:MAG: hypothetical protein WAS51_02945 [Ilumatobacteraceae bacterium]